MMKTMLEQVGIIVVAVAICVALDWVWKQAWCGKPCQLFAERACLGIVTILISLVTDDLLPRANNGAGWRRPSGLRSLYE
jgi:hypothetical protein